MTAGVLAAADLDAFRRLLLLRLGLQFDGSAGPRLAQALAVRLAATGLPVAGYLRLLADDDREPVALATELTVGETYFLRHVEQLRAFAERVLPERLAARGGGRLRLLSAGCSSGEEAYSLAIMLREAAAGVEATVVGTDVNPAALEKARSGRYSSWSLRAVPPEVRLRWFATQGPDVVLHRSVRDAVSFSWSNLATGEPAGLFGSDGYDAVFCRNVMMYFAPAVMAEVVRRLERSLAPGGYLFLGSAETLRGIETDLELCESHGAFYYRRPARTPVPEASLPQPGWYETIRAATARVPAPVPPAREPVALENDDLSAVLALMEDERYDAALAALAGFGAGRANWPEVLLLRAAALTHLGRYHAAEQACHRLLGTGEFAGCAHLLLALGREVEGDLGAAVDRCRSAAAADPAFALPHVHLARLARRAGDLDLAAAAAAEAVRLLPAETDRRILLFGGGFDRDALIRLSRGQAGAS